MQIHRSMNFFMSLVSKLDNLFNELSHRWRLHWRLFRSNSKSFSKSNCVRYLGTKIHIRTHLERTQNWLHISVPHTAVCQSRGSREGKWWFVPERALLVNSCWFHWGWGGNNPLSGSVLKSETNPAVNRLGYSPFFLIILHFFSINPSQSGLAGRRHPHWDPIALPGAHLRGLFFPPYLSTDSRLLVAEWTFSGLLALIWI